MLRGRWNARADDSEPTSARAAGRRDGTGVDFVYPYGCTLRVTPPALPLLTSGAVSYPKGACVVAVSEDMTAEAKRARGLPLQTANRVCQGRVLVLGSVHMLADEWLDKEQNRALARCASAASSPERCFSLCQNPHVHVHEYACRALFTLMLPGRPLPRHKHDARATDVPDKAPLPDLLSLSSRVLGCLEDADALPTDVTTLFCRDMFGFDTARIPRAAQLYHRLGVPKKPLSLIEPQFEQPLPPLRPSVFPPAVYEPPPPPLERFDLDDAFANEYFKVQRLSLTARAQGGHKDAAVVEDYIVKAAQVLGVPGAGGMRAQQALLCVFDDIARWKLQDAGGGSVTFDDGDEGIKI